MPIRGDANICRVEIKNVLYDHLDVVDAAVVGVPHKTLGEDPAAVAHLRPDGGAAKAEPRDRCVPVMRLKAPVKVVFWP